MLSDDTIRFIMDDSNSICEWLEELAARQPTPGGGAAAALAAATAAGLVGMVSIYTTGRKWQDQEPMMLAINQRAAELRTAAVALMAADAEAFGKVGDAYKLPSGTEQESANRKEAIELALTAAAQPPRETLSIAVEIVSITRQLVETANPNVISDVAVAASFAKSAIESAIVNIEINEGLIKSSTTKQSLRSAVSASSESYADTDHIIAAVRQKLRHA